MNYGRLSSHKIAFLPGVARKKNEKWIAVKCVKQHGIDLSKGVVSSDKDETMTVTKKTCLGCPIAFDVRLSLNAIFFKK